MVQLAPATTRGHSPFAVLSRKDVVAEAEVLFPVCAAGLAPCGQVRQSLVVEEVQEHL